MCYIILKYFCMNFWWPALPWRPINRTQGRKDYRTLHVDEQIERKSSIYDNCKGRGEADAAKSHGENTITLFLELLKRVKEI